MKQSLDLTIYPHLINGRLLKKAGRKFKAYKQPAFAGKKWNLGFEAIKVGKKGDNRFNIINLGDYPILVVNIGNVNDGYDNVTFNGYHLYFYLNNQCRERLDSLQKQNSIDVISGDGLKIRILLVGGTKYYCKDDSNKTTRLLGDWVDEAKQEGTIARVIEIPELITEMTAIITTGFLAFEMPKKASEK